MAGIKIQKNYVNISTTSTTASNNWMVLVLGITQKGNTDPTIVQSYNDFIAKFGDPLPNIASTSVAPTTHQYMRFLLNRGISVLFKRIVPEDTFTSATYSYTVGETSTLTKLFTATATDQYKGTIGNNIVLEVSNVSNVCTLVVKYETKVVETYNLGEAVDSVTTGDLLLAFLSEVSNRTISKYVTFTLDSVDENKWASAFTTSATNVMALSGGTSPSNDRAAALEILKSANSDIWKDKKLLNAATYYPQLRFITTGGLIADEIADQDTINKNLGIFADNCGRSFRVLIDYAYQTEDVLTTVRNFVTDNPTPTTSVYSYCGGWGCDSNSIWYPGSAGFLTGLVSGGYNVYSRRIAGTSFAPAFTDVNNKLYIDSLNDWQAKDKIQLNPIVIIDAQDNLAVMGSSTLAPAVSSSTYNPEQALDVVLVGDYIAAILNNIALSELEASLDRLSLNALSSRMSNAVDAFVVSNAITRYDLNFDTTQLGKLGINCVLYFAIGLEEVSLTITSVYDTATIA